MILVVIAAILAASVMLAGSIARGATGGGTALGTSPSPWPSPSPGVVLQVGHNGTFVKQYTLADLEALDAGAAVVNGYAGYEDSGGIVYGPDAVAGINVFDVADDALASVSLPPLTANQSVQFIGSDGYVQPYSDTQLTHVDQMTQLCDATTKKPVSSTSYKGTFLPILVYSDPAGHVFNPNPPDQDGDGPLRLMVADTLSENVVMTGSDSVKWLVKLNVVDTAAKNWSLKLIGLKIKGVRQTRTITRNDFQSCINCHGASYKTQGHKWTGTPLYLFAGQVDGGQVMDFNAALAKKGYRIEVITSKGQKRYVSSRLIVYQGAGRRNVVLAWTRDGLVLGSSSFPLRLVGPHLTASQEIGRITRIVLLPLK
jgi:hypothetical protein